MHSVMLIMFLKDSVAISLLTTAHFLSELWALMKSERQRNADMSIAFQLSASLRFRLINTRAASTQKVRAPRQMYGVEQNSKCM